MTAHTGFRKGTHVFAILTDGTKFDAKFKDKKGRYIYFFDHDRIVTADVKAMSFFKHQPEREPNGCSK